MSMYDDIETHFTCQQFECTSFDVSENGSVMRFASIVPRRQDQRNPRPREIRQTQGEAPRRACGTCKALHLHRQARGVQQQGQGGQEGRLWLPQRGVFLHPRKVSLDPHLQRLIPQKKVKNQIFFINAQNDTRVKKDQSGLGGIKSRTAWLGLRGIWRPCRLHR